METTFNYCVNNGILGVGWRTSSDRNTRVWDEYYEEASKEHDNLNVCRYINEWMNQGDLIWTRDILGQYYIARATSGWEYWTTEESKRLDIDIANIFRCEIKKVNIDDVPGKVVACFRAPRTIQEIADIKAVEYTKCLWNTLSGNNVYEVDRDKFSDIFMMLDDEETEDLVFLYLQSIGWHVIPNSRKADTMSFEYLCVKPSSGELAGTQVKTGNSAINKDEYKDISHKTYLFQSNGNYTGSSCEQVEVIDKEELIVFLKKSLGWLPRAIKRKVEMVGL